MSRICIWCGNSLPKRRRKYCSDECADEYFIKCIAPLWWQNAVAMALKRAGNKCEQCDGKDRLEVHHIVPLERGEARHNSPKNNQDNLEVLCRACHERAHHSLRTVSRIPKEQIPLKIDNRQQVMI